MRSFTFNGHNCNEYGIVCSGEATYDAPARDTTSVTIPGRNGELILDNGRFKNITVTYPAFLRGMDTYAAAARSWLLSPRGYKVLTDDYHPDEFRMGVYTGGISFDPTAWNHNAEVEISFNCKPQRFLVSGQTDVAQTNGGTIENPTFFDSLPLITVTGTGDGTISVGGQTVTLTGLTGGIVLDSDIQDAYYGSLSANSLMTGDFPVLHPGTNGVAWTGGITAVSITPRWWRI